MLGVFSIVLHFILRQSLSLNHELIGLVGLANPTPPQCEVTDAHHLSWLLMWVPGYWTRFFMLVWRTLN